VLLKYCVGTGAKGNDVLESKSTEDGLDTHSMLYSFLGRRLKAAYKHSKERGGTCDQCQHPSPYGMRRNLSDSGLISEGVECLWKVLRSGTLDNMGLSWNSLYTSEQDSLCERNGVSLFILVSLGKRVTHTALLLGFSPQNNILLDTVKEDLTSLGMFDVLYTEIYAFLDVAVSDTLVNQDTDCSWGDIVDDTRASVRQKVHAHTDLSEERVYREEGSKTHP
jgi:hypothetical protein